MSDAPIVSHVASPEYRERVDAMTCAMPECKRWRESEDTLMCCDHRKDQRDRANEMEREEFARYCMRGQYTEYPTPFSFISEPFSANVFPDGSQRFCIHEGFEDFYVRKPEYEFFKARMEARKAKEREE